MASSDRKGFVTFRNRLYHELSRYFDITRDNAQRFASGARRAFASLKCNKIGVAAVGPGNAEHRANTHPRVIHVRGADDGEVVYDNCRFCPDTQIFHVKGDQVVRTNMTTVTSLGGATVTKTAPAGHDFDADPVIPTENSRRNRPVHRQRKGDVTPTSWLRKLFRRKKDKREEVDRGEEAVEEVKTNNSIMIQTLEFDKFWSTSKDADLIL